MLKKTVLAKVTHEDILTDICEFGYAMPSRSDVLSHISQMRRDGARRPPYKERYDLEDGESVHLVIASTNPTTGIGLLSINQAATSSEDRSCAVAVRVTDELAEHPLELQAEVMMVMSDLIDEFCAANDIYLTID